MARRWMLSRSVGNRGLLIGVWRSVKSFEHLAELVADEGGGRHFVDGQPERGDFAGKEVVVGDDEVNPCPVLPVRHEVAVGLPILREQDQRSRIRRLEREYEGQPDE